MQTLHYVLWISAGCLVICMAFDGTFQAMLQSVDLALRFALVKIRCFRNRALAILLALFAGVFRIGADRMENGGAVSRCVWAWLTLCIFRIIHRPVSHLVEACLNSRRI